MRRIAIWIHGGIGGGLFSQGQPAVQQLVGRLAKHFEIDVFSLLPPAEDFDPPDFRIYSAPSRMPWRSWGWLYLVLKFMAISFRNPYRIVYGFWGYPAGSVAVVVGKLCGIPSVVHLQGGDAVGIPSLRYGVFYRPWRAKICRYTYEQCSTLIALTGYQADCLKRNHLFRSPLVIPFGPDLRQFTFQVERFHHPVVRFLHVGNQTPVKGQETMLKVFSRVANQIPARLVIIGEDYYDGRLKEWCTSLGIEEHVQFLGPQPHAMMPHFYHNADILLHTALYEGQGLVFAEAAACGTVIAGTAVGMLADMGDGCALCVSPDDVQILPGKIIAALKEKQSLRDMQTLARDWIAEKDVNYTEGRIVEMLNELVTMQDLRSPGNLRSKWKGNGP